MRNPWLFLALLCVCVLAAYIAGFLTARAAGAAAYESALVRGDRYADERDSVLAELERIHEFRTDATVDEGFAPRLSLAPVPCAPRTLCLSGY